MSTNVPNLSDTLRGLRESKELSQDALAKLVGVSARTILNYEAGHRTPGIWHVQRLAKALGTTPGYLASLRVPAPGSA